MCCFGCRLGIYVEFDYMGFVGFVNLIPDLFIYLLFFIFIFIYDGFPLLGCVSCLCCVVHNMFIVDCHNNNYL